MTHALELLSVLYLLSGLSAENTCPVPDLFNDFRDEFGKPNSTLKEVNGGGFYKCLAMYAENPTLSVNENTIEASSNVITTLALEVINQLISGQSLDHSDYHDKFMETCFYKQHLRDFWKAIFELTSGGGPAYTLKLTCPLGLLWDIICTFESCLHSRCDVNGASCTETKENQLSCPKLSLKLFCKDSFISFINSCVEDISYARDDIVKRPRDDIVNALDNSLTNDNGCPNLNLIYQGLTSIQAVEENVIAVSCPKSKKGNFVLKCFKSGKVFREAIWHLDDTVFPSDSNGTLNITSDNLQQHKHFSCFDGDVKLTKIHSEHAQHLCSTVDKEVATKPPTTISPYTTSPTPAPDPNKDKKDKRDAFYRNEDIWLTKKTYGSLDGIDAFENKAELRENVGNLSIAMVSVMGRLTPICGELWNEDAAKVFCRDAGAQMKQNWTASYVGSVHKDKNEKHINNTFYKHYLRNITCKGNESNIIWCDHDGWYQHECTHDAVVICSAVKDDGDHEPNTITDTKLRNVLIGVCGGLFLLGLIVVGCVYKIRIHYPDKYNTLRRKINGLCYHQLDPADIRSRGSTVTTAFTCDGMSQTVSLGQPSETNPGNGSESWGSSLFDLGGSISRPRFEDEPSTQYPVSIQEHHLLRLNSKNAPQWVLLYKMEEEEYVCKSFTNVKEDENDMKTERFFLEKANHPNIVKLCELQNPREIMFENERKIYFFMERLELGGLDSYLRSKNSEDGNGINHGHLMTVEDATNVMVGVCRALNFVHTKGYAHADICSDNFFAFRNIRNGLLDVKLGDFETFRRPPVTDWKNMRCTARCTAPEIILDDPRDENGHQILKDAFKNDVWGLALVLWEIQSWIMCKNNKFSSKSVERSVVPAQTSIMMSLSRFMRSRFEHSYDYTCRSQVHIALLQKINNVNPRKVSAKPDMILMREFYERIHPHSMGYPPMDPKLDCRFHWPITNLLKKCLRINSNIRSSMSEVMKYLLDSAIENPDSPLAKYKTVLDKDLNSTDYIPFTDCESDVDPIDLGSPPQPSGVFSPPTLQPNLGQLYSSYDDAQIDYAV